MPIVACVVYISNYGWHILAQKITLKWSLLIYMCTTVQTTGLNELNGYYCILLLCWWYICTYETKYCGQCVFLMVALFYTYVLTHNYIGTRTLSKPFVICQWWEDRYKSWIESRWICISQHIIQCILYNAVSYLWVVIMLTYVRDILGSCHGLSPFRRRAIDWTGYDFSALTAYVTYFSEIDLN